MMADDPAADGGEPAGEPANAEPTAKTFTQDQVNDLIAREKGKIQAKYSDVDDLRKKATELDELKAANATELEKAQAKQTKAETDAAEAKARLLRYEVAAEKEVPAKLVALLTATDKEGLEAQADLILENAKPASPDFDGGAREPAPEPLSPEEQHNETVLKLLGIERS